MGSLPQPQHILKNMAGIPSYPTPLARSPVQYAWQPCWCDDVFPAPTCKETNSKNLIMSVDKFVIFVRYRKFPEPFTVSALTLYQTTKFWT